MTFLRLIHIFESQKKIAVTACYERHATSIRIQLTVYRNKQHCRIESQSNEGHISRFARCVRELHPSLHVNSLASWYDISDREFVRKRDAIRFRDSAGRPAMRYQSRGDWYLMAFSAWARREREREKTITRREGRRMRAPWRVLRRVNHPRNTIHAPDRL